MSLNEHASPCQFPHVCAECSPLKKDGKPLDFTMTIRFDCPEQGYPYQDIPQPAISPKSPFDDLPAFAQLELLKVARNEGAPYKPEWSPLQDICTRCHAKRASHRFDQGCEFVMCTECTEAAREVVYINV